LNKTKQIGKNKLSFNKKNKMDIIELVVNEYNLESGVDAISLVEYPAIEEDFVALNSHKVEFKAISEDKRIIVGLALIPDKLIYRRMEREGMAPYEYNIFFTKETVRKVAELYLMRHKGNNATLEHEVEVDGVSLVESWIVEDPKTDKTALYNLNAVEGAWAVVLRVNNDEVWAKVKNGTFKGLSIEGKFSDKMASLAAYDDEEQDETELEALTVIEELLAALESVDLASYDDYPQAASDNAQKVLNWRKRYGDEVNGMTAIGWRRANQLAKRQNISRETIARMASFARHRKNAAVVPEYRGKAWKDAGHVAWLGWGGTEGIEWAQRKLAQIKRGE
jgi:hypothetical protein